MKLSLKTLTVALAAITLSPAALADTAKDGTVHITGLIKQNACTVKTDSVEVTLQEEFASLSLPQGRRQGIQTSPSNSKTATQTSTAVYRRALKAHSTEPMRPS